MRFVEHFLSEAKSLEQGIKLVHFLASVRRSYLTSATLLKFLEKGVLDA
jgi:hypothetical protein